MHDEVPELKSSYYPPRAGWLTPVYQNVRRARTQWSGMLPGVSAPVSWRQTLLALVVPGMGFRVYGRQVIGWGVLAGWTLSAVGTICLLPVGQVQFLLFAFDPVYVAIGLMAALHAMSASFFAQRCLGWDAPRQRMLLSIAITGLLLLLVYMPLTQALTGYANHRRAEASQAETFPGLNTYHRT